MINTVTQQPYDRGRKVCSFPHGTLLTSPTGLVLLVCTGGQAVSLADGVTHPTTWYTDDYEQIFSVTVTSKV